jgi:transposase
MIDLLFKYNLLEKELQKILIRLSNLEQENKCLKADNLKLKADSEELKADNLKLKADNEELRSNNLILKADNEKLRANNLTLKADNDGLKERLGLNCKNSSIPSSKELYKIKNKTPRKKSERNQGAQKGHKGHVREVSQADHIVDVNLESNLCECGGKICLSGKPHIHQNIELPEIKPIVTQYNLQRGRCNLCGKRRKAKLPDNATSDLFGPKVKSTIAALNGFYKNSKRETENILKNLFNLKISLGTISNSEARVSNLLKDAYEDIESELSYSKLLHIDETSHYNKGKLGWCWMFTNNNASMIKLEDSRGMKVLEKSVFGKDDSVIVTDRYAAYNYFNSQMRQICWAHLLRDFERFANSLNIGIKDLGEYLKKIAMELFGLRKALCRDQIDMKFFLRRVRKLRKRSSYYLYKIICTKSAIHAARVAKNILRSEEMMWRFMDDVKNIPLTNNHAERQIRHYVLYRKNSYFTQSERGNRFLERIISLYLTWKQRNLNPVTELQNLLLPKS